MGNLQYILTAIILVPLLGMFFIVMSKQGHKNTHHNAFDVAAFSIISNIFLLWRASCFIDINSTQWQLKETYSWLLSPKIEFVLGIDIFSLLLILSVHIALLMGFVGIRGSNAQRQKSLAAFSMLFLSMITGYFVAADLFSFYIFFAAMLLPLFMLVRIYGAVKKQQVLQRFFLYNLWGVLLLFMAISVLYNQESIDIKSISKLKLDYYSEIFAWGAIFLAFLSRIPIWPFHYWISSINSNISNPLAFIVANIMPLTGVYGLIRFSPLDAPDVLKPYVFVLEVVSIISMLTIALIAFSNKDIKYRLFSYMTVFYIFYLLGALLPTDKILLNIGLSLSSYIVIVSSLEVLAYHFESQRMNHNVSTGGILSYTPKTSFVFSFMILAAIGCPLSSLFLNNFTILAGLIKFNIKMAAFILFAILLCSLNLLQSLFYLKYPSKKLPLVDIADISKATFAFMLIIMLLLLMSFVNPLWFVG